MEFYLENPLIGLPENESDTIPWLFASEVDHMPPQSYFSTFKAESFDISIRLQVITFILQFSGKFNPFISYLAINYFHRFMFKIEIPQGKPWISKLISLSCISLAAKMEETGFTLEQKEQGFMFDQKTIHRMELMILNYLDWRMRSITPFAFISFFISLLNLENPSSLAQSLKARVTEIIFKAQKEIKLLYFKPSIVAASAFLYATQELLPSQFPTSENLISTSEYVNKEMLLECGNVLKEMMVADKYNSVINFVSSSQTPDNVLQLCCASLESGKVGSNGTTMGAEPDTKRPKFQDSRAFSQHLSNDLSSNRNGKIRMQEK